MGIEGLRRAVERGAPLVDVVVRFRDGVDYDAATRAMNALADDFDLISSPYHDAPALRLGTATKEALERLFGWRLARVPLESYDEATGEWGTWPDVFRWEALNEPRTCPASVAGLIESMAITQPGSDDEGQWYE